MNNKTKDIFSQPFFLIGLAFMVIGVASSSAFVVMGIIFMALGWSEAEKDKNDSKPEDVNNRHLP